MDAHENGLRVGIVSSEIVYVVRCDERDPRILGKAEKLTVYFLLLLDTVVLYFKIVAVLSEKGTHEKGVLLGFFIVAADQKLWNIACQTRGKADEPLVMLGEQFHIDAGLGIEALGVGFGDHIAKIFVARFVLAKQDEMIARAVCFVAFIEA